MVSSITFFHLISLISAFLSFSLGFFLFFIKSKTNSSNIFLGILVWLYSFWFYPGAFDALGILDKVPHVIMLRFFSGTLIGLFTYLYCKTSIQKKTLLFKDIYYHFIPLLVVLSIHIPFLLKGKEEKLAIFRALITNGKVFEPKILVLTKVIFTLFYITLSIKIIFRYLKHIKNTSTVIDKSFHRWLLFINATLLLPIILVLFLNVIEFELTSISFVLFSISIFIFIIYISLVLCPKFFHHFPHQIENLNIRSVIKTKYLGSNLQEQQKNIYKSKLLRYMKESKAYLDSELTINTFSEQVKIPSHYLSQVINQQLNSNFIDFINGYRIGEVKEKLSNSSLNHYTVMAIAYESGFNSKTAFYTTFKKIVKKTPSQFRKEAISIPI